MCCEFSRLRHVLANLKVEQAMSEGGEAFCEEADKM